MNGLSNRPGCANIILHTTCSVTCVITRRGLIPKKGILTKNTFRILYCSPIKLSIRIKIESVRIHTLYVSFHCYVLCIRQIQKSYCIVCRCRIIPFRLTKHIPEHPVVLFIDKLQSIRNRHLQ